VAGTGRGAAVVIAGMVAAPGINTQEPVVGFRAYRARAGRLYSLSGELSEWLPGATVDARCEVPGNRVPHQAPARGCHCGAYAVDSLATLDRYLDHHLGWKPWRRGEIVLAAVQLWGAPGRRVIVGEAKRGRGLAIRAPHMRILALASSRKAERVARATGLPVVAREHLELVARDRGGVQLRPAERQRGRQVTADSSIDWSDLVWLGQGTWWCLRHLAPPILLCSLHLVAAPTWWAMRNGPVAAWWLARVSYTRLWLLPELVGLVAAGFHWRWPVFITGVQLCLGAGVVRWVRGRVSR
jgi:hypothetical protein